MPRSPGDSWSGLSRTGQLDLLLATSVLEGGLRGQRLLDYKLARDASLVVGALGLRGVNVTLADVESSIRGTSGRYSPGQTEFELIRGVRRAIDRIDQAADRGELPAGSSLGDLYDIVTTRIPALGCSRLRQEDPWDALPRIDYPAAKGLPEMLRGFTAEGGYLAAPEDFRGRHPIEQGACVFHGFAKLAPFPDYNLLIASLGASWYLMALGYPPFLPQATDRGAMEQVLVAGASELREWFAEVVLVGYKALRFAAEGRWS